MSKKVVSIVALVVLLLTLVVNAFAIEPMMDISRAAGEVKVAAYVTFDKDGNAKATGSVTTLPANYTAKVTVELQKKSGGSWVKVKEGTGGRSACALSKATSGVSYRAHATYDIWDNNGKKLDVQPKNSGSKTY